MDFKKAKGTSVVIVLFLFVASFFLGRYAAQVAPVSGRAIQPGADGNWGLSFQEEGQPPVANASFEELAKYNAYYAEDTQEKVRRFGEEIEFIRTRWITLLKKGDPYYNPNFSLDSADFTVCLQDGS